MKKYWGKNVCCPESSPEEKDMFLPERLSTEASQDCQAQFLQSGSQPEAQIITSAFLSSTLSGSAVVDEPQLNLDLQ